MTITVEALTGPDRMAPALPALARLRITVFREWPYLYEGTLDYEQDYLDHFSEAEGAVIVVARDGAEIVGAATAAPLGEHTKSFVPLFEARGFDPARIFYCGESVLLPAYRGRGLGHAFFDEREAHARRIRPAGRAFTHATFCGVVRPADHPLRPQGYVPLDAFWMKRGYARVEGLLGSYSWLDLGDSAETEKPMQFWMKQL